MNNDDIMTSSDVGECRVAETRRKRIFQGIYANTVPVEDQ